MADSPPAHPDKTPIVEGHRRLEAARFSDSEMSAGARGEVWFSPSGKPVYVSYIGPRFGQYFSTESLENALAQK